MNKTIISIIVVVLILIGGFFLFNGEDEATQVDTIVDAGQKVVIRGHQLPPNDLEIEVGTTVLWENKDSFVGLPYSKHTITSGSTDRTGRDGVRGVVPNSGSGISDGTFKEGLKLNKSFSYTFTEVGIYPFYIAEHPTVSGERKIIVREKSQLNDEEIIVMIAKPFSFSPDSIQAKVNEEVIIDVTATGQHTFTIDELEVNIILPHGEITRVQFTPEIEGTFEFYCAVPGHRGGGMFGSITVE